MVIENFRSHCCCDGISIYIYKYITFTYKCIQSISLINRHICQEIKHIQDKGCNMLEK